MKQATCYVVYDHSITETECCNVIFLSQTKENI